MLRHQGGSLAYLGFAGGIFHVFNHSLFRSHDGIVITGPISGNMAEATRICYDAVPNPKIVVLAGSAAISGGFLRAVRPWTGGFSTTTPSICTCPATRFTRSVSRTEFYN